VIAARILLWIWPLGTTGVIMTVVLKGGLLVWAGDEIFRGVNPWRRFLGGAVFVYELATILI
jgi:hypothetical protein